MKIGLRRAVAVFSILAVLFVFCFVIYGTISRQGSGNTGTNVVSQAPEVQAPVVQAEQPVKASEELAVVKNDISTQEAPKETKPEPVKAAVVKAPVKAKVATIVKQAPKTSTVKKPVQVKTVSSTRTTAVKSTATSTTAVKPAATSTAVKPSSKGDTIVQIAKQYFGRPYVFGTAGPNSFDCSGLTMYVFGKAGISISRTSKAQAQSGKYVPRDQLRPGDLVFFTTDGTGNVSHVGIYAGGDLFIQAPRTGEVVGYAHLSSSYFSNRYVTARRYY